MADTSRRLAGLAWLSIDGVSYPVVSDPAWRVASVTRETLVSMGAVDGYKETIVPGFIEATIRDTASTTVRGFQDMTSVSVTLRLANGKQVSGTGMWTTEAVEVNSTDATFKVRFEGQDVEEN
ncbi:MAG: phage tail tube protein [Microbispora sp.]|nr:phage tail tube protein [Microbispora sp.]